MKILKLTWYVGVALSIALVGGVFALLGWDASAAGREHATGLHNTIGALAIHPATFAANPENSGLIWPFVNLLADLLPLVAIIGCIAAALLLIGYFGIRHPHNHVVTPKL